MERSEDRKADGSNSSTVFWATGRQNVLIFEGCSEAVCAPSAWKETLSLCSPQRLHLIKQWEKSGEYYTFFLSSASWLIVVLVQFWNSIPLFVRSRCDPLCSSHSFGKAGFRRRCLDVSSLCRGGHDRRKQIQKGVMVVGEILHVCTIWIFGSENICTVTSGRWCLQRFGMTVKVTETTGFFE